MTGRPLSSGRRPWTDEELGFLQSPPRGWTNADIAECLGRTTATVRGYRRRLREGWSPRTDLYYTDDFLEAVAASFDRVIREVADELDCSPDRIKRARRFLRDTGRLSQDTKQRWVRPQRPYEVGDRTLLAKTCVGCGLLWGGAHFPFTRASSERGSGAYGDMCYRCKNARFRDGKHFESRTAAAQAAHVTAMEKATEALATEAIPYRSNHRQPWTESDVALLRRRDLTMPEIAAQLGRSWSAAWSACNSYGIYRPRERATQLPTGEWRIEFPDLGVAS